MNNDCFVMVFSEGAIEKMSDSPDFAADLLFSNFRFPSTLPDYLDLGTIHADSKRK
jgi:hypothetical protein